MFNIRFRVLAASAAVTAGVLGAGLAAGSASAATPSCGSSCIDAFSFELGTHHSPQFVLDVYKQSVKVGQKIILFRSANDDPAEDFTVSDQGPLSDFYAAGLVSSAVALHYGCAGSVAVASAQIPCGPASQDDYAWEIEYAPYGVDSGLCVGVAGGTSLVSLQACGVNGDTVLITDTADAAGFTSSYVPVIVGSDVNFSHPTVITYPAAAYPTDASRPQLKTAALTGFSNGTGNDPTGTDGNQEWGADFGTLP